MPADHESDRIANTQAFRAFTERDEQPVPEVTRSRSWLLVGGLALVVVVVVVVLALI